VMLLSFYLSMPPWPGLPESPKLEGHYRFVNKNLVEMVACLVLASTPNGLWIGLDALLFGRSSKTRTSEDGPEGGNGRTEGGPASKNSRKSKSR
jgi:hypothetical protein